jgi:hypothetical protein
LIIEVAGDPVLAVLNRLGPFNPATVEGVRTAGIEGAARGNCRKARHGAWDLHEALGVAFQGRDRAHEALGIRV